MRPAYPRLLGRARTVHRRALSKMIPPKLWYILRHGAVQSESTDRRYTGQTDLALSDIGIRQAHAWAGYFKTMALDAIYSSDLERCAKTAGIIGTACSVPVSLTMDLREVDMGTWDGTRFDDIKTWLPKAFKQRGLNVADHRPPSGESFRDLQTRVWQTFRSLSRKSESNTLIVTHAGVIRVLLCRLLGVPIDHLFTIRQGYGALNIIESPDGPRARALNLAPPVA